MGKYFIGWLVGIPVIVLVIFYKESIMEATDKTNTVDDTVDRLRSGAHSTVDKPKNRS